MKIDFPESLSSHRFLVTGAAGMIGAATSREILDRGGEVVGIDNLNDYYPPELKRFRIRELEGSPRFKFFPMDIENAAAVEDIFRSAGPFSAVINLAARAGVRASCNDPVVYLQTNALGTLNLLESMRKTGTRKLVLASTSSLYAGLPLPFHEDLAVNQPISPYAATKKAAEAMAYTYHFLYGLDVSVLRYFTVYGPGGRPDMSIFRFIEWIYKGIPVRLFGDGTRGRDFTHTEDIARGTVEALRPFGYEVINLGGGNNPIPMNSLISEIAANLGRDPLIDYQPAVKADMENTSADISKAARLLEWQPEISFSDGIRSTVQWHLENRALLDSLTWE